MILAWCEAWHAMNTWVTDNVPLAGGAFRQLIVDLYRNDKLMRGELMIRGQRVDLSRIHANLLTVIAEDDHITPSCQSEPIMSKVSSADKELFASGRSYRDHGGQRSQQVHLAAHRWLAGTSPLSSLHDEIAERPAECGFCESDS